ncbi:metallophosphoesterase, partial [Pseudomonas sp. HMWF031]
MGNSGSRKISWLHLSDFHMGKEGYSQSFVLSKIVDNIKEKIESGHEPDFIFITGDIANKGLESEYDSFWEHLIVPLDELMPTMLTDKLFMIPGNHDLNRNKNDAFDRTVLLKPTAPYFNPDEESKEKREIVVARFEKYIEHDVTGYSELFRKKEGAYSTTIQKNGCTIGIVGLNTAWLCKDEHDYQRLTPGKPILENALSNLQNPELTIVLGHHPMDWFSTDHLRPISALLGQHNALYLHGHMHHAWASPSYGAGNHFLNLQCGAAFQAHEADKWKNGLLWAEADLNTQTVALQAYEWSNNHQEWVINEEAFPSAHKQGEYWKYILPKKMNAIYKETLESNSGPLLGGWDINSVEMLRVNLAELPLDEAVSFFNGAVPTWRTALSSSIPRRRIVQKTANIFKALNISDKPIVGLISSAGCE